MFIWRRDRSGLTNGLTPETDAAQSSAEPPAADREDLPTLLDDPATDLPAVVPNGVNTGGQTWLRAVLLVADHAAYHVGQLALLGRLLRGGPDCWRSPADLN